jgi:hypothetical protein
MQEKERLMSGRVWFGTYNNCEDGEAFLAKLHEEHKALYVIGQMEKGESGTPHL